MRSNRTLLFVSAILLFSLSACLGPQKINKWVARHYQDEPSDAPKRKNEQITVSSKLPDMGVHLSETEKNTSHVLPLIFYWQYDYKNTCTLNPQLPVNNFTAAVNAYAGHGLKQKLKDNRLELTVEQIPHVFAIDDKGHIIWVIYAFGWDYLTIQPATSNLVVSYRVLSAGNAEIKHGTITIADIDKGMSLKMLQSLKKMTWQYLQQYDANITVMSKKVIDQLVSEL
jgi:hypothetical protein